MLTIVKQAQGSIELITAAKMACDRNEQVRSYLGNRLDLKHNWKLQTLREMLVNNLSIKQVKEKPIVLQWFESGTSLTSHPSHNRYGTNQSQTSRSKIDINACACDVSEVCDDNKGETITHSQMTFDQKKKGNNISNNGSIHNQTRLYRF